MRKLYAALAAAGMVVALAVPALAATDDIATMSVDVPTAYTIEFTDDTAAFGTVLPGGTATQVDTLAYTVSTNVSTGYIVRTKNGTGNVAAAAGWFEVGTTSTFATLFSIGDTAGSTLASTWRARGTAGSQNYLDSVRVTVPSNTPVGSYTMTALYEVIAT